MNFNQNDLDTLTRTIYGEARGESREGKIAVGWVIRNRASRSAFATSLVGQPGAIARVCRAPWQFSCWNADDPNLPKLLDMKTTGSDEEIVAMAVLGTTPDPTIGADHYHTISIKPYWAPYMRKTVTIGNHVFYNSQAVTRPVLTIGSSGPYVTSVQLTLALLGFYHGGTTGIYDAEVYDAVRAYQKKKGLLVDGITGDQTYNSLGIQ